jgi:hypothetical protein
LTQIKTAARGSGHRYAVRHVIFKCPHTGMNVQHRLATEAESDHQHVSYETVVCKACSRLHFINRSTGKVLGQHDD